VFDARKITPDSFADRIVSLSAGCNGGTVGSLLPDWVLRSGGTGGVRRKGKMMCGPNWAIG